MQGFISSEDYPRFKKEYENAVKNGDECFDFDGKLVLVKFAKYVCEYFELCMGGKK